MSGWLPIDNTGPPCGKKPRYGLVLSGNRVYKRAVETEPEEAAVDYWMNIASARLRIEVLA